MNLATLSYPLLLGILPALLWLWFWLREDNLHPEPRSTIVFSFILGAVVVVLAIVLEKYSANLFENESYKYILWAAIEELVKLLAVVIIALYARKLDEPIDAMIYCITVALGFSALENALFVLSPIYTGDIARGIITGNMRFIGATLVHTVSSASIGFMIGLSFYKKPVVQNIFLATGVILSIVLHSAFNLSIIDTSAIGTLKVFGFVWIAVVILIILFEEIKMVKPKYYKDKIN